MRYFSFPQPATRMALLWSLLLCLWAGQQKAQAFVITTQAVQGGTSFCAGGPLRVPYAVDQPFNSGNVFTAQLSDDAGSFAAPVNIGSLAGTSNGLIQTIIPAATAAGSGYRVRVVSSNPVVTGTDNGTDLTVVNLGPLTAGANTPLCVGDNLLLTASLVPGASYFWTGPAGFNSQLRNPTIANVSVGRSGTYTVTASANGCSTSAQVQVAVSPLPVVTIAPNNPNICAGTSVQLTASGGVSYAWSPATGLSSTTIANPIASPTSSIIYTVTATNAQGCSSTTQVTVTVRATPVVSVTPTSPTICAGSSVTLTATGAQSYVWSPSAGLNSPFVANPIAFPSQTTTYTVTGNSNGCTSTATVTVTVEPLPAANAGPAQVLCSGQSTTLGAPAVPGLTYSWSPSTGLSATNVAQPTITPINNANNPRTTTYTLTVVSAGGCVATSSVQVTVNPAVTAVAGPNRTLCPNQSGQLGVGATPGTTYSWSPTTGLSSPTAANPTVTLPNATNAPVAQVYTLTASRNGCQSTATVTVTVNPAQNAAFSYGAAVLCTAAGNPTPTLGGTSPGTFTAAPAGLVFVSAATGQIDATASTPGTYTVTFTTAGPCADTRTASVTLTNSPSAAFQYPSPTYCLGSGTAVPALAGGASSGVFSSTAGLVLNAATGAIDLAASTAGTYTVTNTVGSGGSCSATSSTTVALAAGANVAATASQPSICAGQSTTLTATGGLTYTYTDGSQTFTGASITVSPTQTTTYTVTGTTASGCTSTATVTVTVNPTPVITAGASVAAVCAGQSATLSASGASSITFTGGGQTFSGPLITVTPTQTTTYTVTGTNASGCSSSTTLTVVVNALPVVALALPGATQCLAAGALTLSGGSPAGGTFSGPGVANGVFDPVATGPGSYTLTYSFTNPQGCSGTATAQLVVVATPTVTATAAQPTICSGQSTLLTFGGAATYSTTGGGQTQPGASLTVSPTQTTTYVVTGTNAGGCASTASVTVTVNPTPVIALTGVPASLCASAAPVTLTATPAGGTFSGPGVSNGVFDPAVAGVGTFAITYSATNAQGCSATATQQLTVGAQPTVTATASLPALCAGQSTTLAFGGAATYSVTGGGQTMTGATVTVSPTQTTTYTVTGTTAGGCSGTASVTVTVNPAATAALTPFAASVCNNGPLLTLSGGSPAGGVYSGPGVVNGVFNPATVGAGTYTITYTTTTAAGCAAAATQPLSVTACTPTATASGAPAVGLTLHPNPSSGRVVLTLTGTVRPQHAPQVVVLNVLGQEVNRATLSVTGAGSLAHALDLHEYADGVYLLRLDPGNGQWLTRRLVLRH